MVLERKEKVPSEKPHHKKIIKISKPSTGTWNSKTLSEPQSHTGMSPSEGFPSSDTHSGSPFL